MGFIWWAFYFPENIYHFLAKQHKMISVGRGAFLYHFEVILKIRDFLGGRLYESPRAVNMVDGLPRAPSYINHAPEQFRIFRHKSASCSESVNAIDMGTICPPRLGHYLWDTVFLVSSLSF